MRRQKGRALPSGSMDATFVVRVKRESGTITNTKGYGHFVIIFNPFTPRRQQPQLLTSDSWENSLWLWCAMLKQHVFQDVMQGFPVGDMVGELRNFLPGTRNVQNIFFATLCCSSVRIQLHSLLLLLLLAGCDVSGARAALSSS